MSSIDIENNIALPTSEWEPRFSKLIETIGELEINEEQVKIITLFYDNKNIDKPIVEELTMRPEELYFKELKEGSLPWTVVLKSGVQNVPYSIDPEEGIYRCVDGWFLKREPIYDHFKAWCSHSNLKSVVDVRRWSQYLETTIGGKQCKPTLNCGLQKNCWFFEKEMIMEND